MRENRESTKHKLFTEFFLPERLKCCQVSKLSLGRDFYRSVINYLFAFITLPEKVHHMGVKYKWKEGP